MNGSVDWYKKWEEAAVVWFDWSKQLLIKNEFPFSGNIDQVVHAMMEKIGQLGFINITLPSASRNPTMEWSILSKWSYGRQIGRIIDLLDTIADAHKDELMKRDPKAYEDFKELSARVRDIKAGK